MKPKPKLPRAFAKANKGLANVSKTFQAGQQKRQQIASGLSQAIADLQGKQAVRSQMASSLKGGDKIISHNLAGHYGTMISSTATQRQSFLRSTAPSTPFKGASNKRELKAFKKVNRGVGAGASRQAKRSKPKY